VLGNRRVAHDVEGARRNKCVKKRVHNCVNKNVRGELGYLREL